MKHGKKKLTKRQFRNVFNKTKIALDKASLHLFNVKIDAAIIVFGYDMVEYEIMNYFKIRNTKLGKILYAEKD